MEVTVQLRLTATTKPFELSLETLKARIRRGEVAPTVFIRDRILTDDEWRTIDNLNLFHRNTPVVHPPGDHLVAKQAEERPGDEQERQALEQMQAYDGNLICKCLELASLSDLLQRPAVLGLTRFFVLPSFEPEAVFTFLFERELIRIDAARGETQIWGSLSHLGAGIASASVGLRHEVKRFDPSKTQRATAIVSASKAPTPLKEWSSVLLTASEAAPLLDTGMLDGIGYRHELRSKENAIDAEWINPSGKNTPQMRLIQAYRECLEMANLIHLMGRSYR